LYVTSSQLEFFVWTIIVEELFCCLLRQSGHQSVVGPSVSPVRVIESSKMSVIEIFSNYPLYLAALAIYFAGIVASAGGIGGGGVVMPLLRVLGQFPLHDAVRLSQCAVFGNSLAQCLINFSRSHPYDITRPLIYYEIVLVMLPTTLLGSFVGVLISKVFPETIILILAMMTLSYAVYRTYLKGQIYYKTENESMRLKNTMYQKLIDHSLHSPTRIGRETVYSEQVSVSLFDDDDSNIHHDDDDLQQQQQQQQRTSVADKPGRWIPPRQPPTTTFDDLDDPEEDMFARLLDATVPTGLHAQQSSQSSQSWSSSKQPQQHSLAQGRVDSADYFRDNRRSVADNDHHHHDAANNNKNNNNVREWEDFAAALRNQEQRQQQQQQQQQQVQEREGLRETTTTRDSQDTVLVNPTSLSMAGSRNVTSHLLRSTAWEVDDDDDEEEEVDIEKQENGEDNHAPAAAEVSSPLFPQHHHHKNDQQHAPKEMDVKVERESDVFRVLPMLPILLSLFVWVLNLLLFVVQQYTAETCTSRYYLEMISVVPVLFAIIVWTLFYLKVSHVRQLRVDCLFHSIFR
jgi:hypothetical protein